MSSAGEDLVVLLDADRQPCGVAPRATVHDTNTPLHLAFSCYVFSPAGALLMTRRSLHKRTWPGVWTNSCCGHPRPGERVEDAVARRLEQELGLVTDALDCRIPQFAYRAVDASGTEENEVCPVFVTVCEGEPRPDPDEVAEHRWLAWDAAVEVARGANFLISPWASAQIPLLAASPAASAAPAHPG
ncbi:MAG TPA: isopentenyl-diphosphate Delta-isomerase [Kineosporiaceae bacterium]